MRTEPTPLSLLDNSAGLLRLPGLDLTRAAWRSGRIGSLVVYFTERVETLGWGLAGPLPISVVIIS